MSTVTAKIAREHRVTIPSLLARKQRAERIAMLTAYDFTFASLFDAAEQYIQGEKGVYVAVLQKMTVNGFF